MAASLNADDRARKEAAKAALAKPTIPATEQALADADVHLQAQREAEAFAAEAAAVRASDDLPAGYVKCRVLRKGAGKIYTGQHDPSVQGDPADKFTRYKYGAIIALPDDVAYAQEMNEHLEVLGTAARIRLGLPLEEQ